MVCGCVNIPDDTGWYSWHKWKSAQGPRGWNMYLFNPFPLYCFTLLLNLCSLNFSQWKYKLHYFSFSRVKNKIQEQFVPTRAKLFKKVGFPRHTKARDNKTGNNFYDFYYKIRGKLCYDFSVWLKTSWYPPDMNLVSKPYWKKLLKSRLNGNFVLCLL